MGEHTKTKQKYLYHDSGYLPCYGKALIYVGPDEIMPGSKVRSSHFRYLNGDCVNPEDKRECGSCGGGGLGIKIKDIHE